jgi:FtsH-binding integral membrane protein
MYNTMNPDALATRATSVNRVYNFVYGWMSIALAISGGLAWYIAECMKGLSSDVLIGCVIAQIVLVLILRLGFRKLSSPAIAGLFIAFAACIGATLSVFLEVYTSESVYKAFFITAGTFAGMALIGTTTKKDLSTIGRVCLMALLGIIVVSIVNFFLASDAISFMIDLISLAVFIGLTAYDAQNVRRLAEAEMRGEVSTGEANRLGLILALELYLDVIILFETILNLLGDRK